MYGKVKMGKSSIEINETTEGESIEEKVNRILNNKEGITDGAPIIHTERKDGVKEAYNIRTDRWEIAVEATDKIAKQKAHDREARMKVVKDDGEPKPKGEDGKAEPTQGKTSTE